MTPPKVIDPYGFLYIGAVVCDQRQQNGAPERTTHRRQDRAKGLGSDKCFRCVVIGRGGQIVSSIGPLDRVGRRLFKVAKLENRGGQNY